VNNPDAERMRFMADWIESVFGLPGTGGRIRVLADVMERVDAGDDATWGEWFRCLAMLAEMLALLLMAPVLLFIRFR
jgi:hypothetical protein